MNYNHWQKDLKDSTKAILSIKDTILSKLISGKILSIEDSNDEILILLDQKSGIDFLRENQTGLQGIAARVQWGRAYNTFTIRKERYTQSKTELEKRLSQIENGYIYPAFTLQAYFDKRESNNLLSIAIIRTKDLYTFIKDNPNKTFTMKSDNIFLCVSWDHINNLIKKYPK